MAQQIAKQAMVQQITKQVTAQQIVEKGTMTDRPDICERNGNVVVPMRCTRAYTTAVDEKIAEDISQYYHVVVGIMAECAGHQRRFPRMRIIPAEDFSPLLVAIHKLVCYVFNYKGSSRAVIVPYILDILAEVSELAKQIAGTKLDYGDIEDADNLPLQTIRVAVHDTIYKPLLISTADIIREFYGLNPCAFDTTPYYRVLPDIANWGNICDNDFDTLNDNSYMFIGAGTYARNMLQYDDEDHKVAAAVVLNNAVTFAIEHPMLTL